MLECVRRSVQQGRCRHTSSKVKESKIYMDQEVLTDIIAAPCWAVKTTCIVALSPALTVALSGRDTFGRQTVPGKGLLLGPKNANCGTKGTVMCNGPPSGPVLPNPRLTCRKPLEWPTNHPGWKAIVPLLVGQYVRFCVTGVPPPAKQSQPGDPQSCSCGNKQG